MAIPAKTHAQPHLPASLSSSSLQETESICWNLLALQVYKPSSNSLPFKSSASQSDTLGVLPALRVLPARQGNNRTDDREGICLCLSIIPALPYTPIKCQEMRTHREHRLHRQRRRQRQDASLLAAVCETAGQARWKGRVEKVCTQPPQKSSSQVSCKQNHTGPVVTSPPPSKATGSFLPG